MKRIKDSAGFGLLLNLLLPGAGHIYFREYLFGIFVLLVMLIAVVLFFLSYLVSLPGVATLVLFGLPAIFYSFTFLDLWRVIKRKDVAKPRTARSAGAYLAVSVLVMLLVPLSPVNFFLRNAPRIAEVQSNQLSPILKPGDVCWVDRLAYRVNLFFVDQPVRHSNSERWEVIQFRDDPGTYRLGLVIGLPGEEVAYFNDSLFVDGYPEPRPETLADISGGRLPLTLAGPGSILVATLDQGAVDRCHEIPARDIIGKVHRLF